MQKIRIKNFGPIPEAEIEIKNILVLIGEQASGKSTIAKLIYFFKSLSLANIAELLLDEFDKKKYYEQIEKKFRNSFGYLCQTDFSIKYTYSLDGLEYIEISNTYNKLKISFKLNTFENFTTDFSKVMNQMKIGTDNYKDILAELKDDGIEKTDFLDFMPTKEIAIDEFYQKKPIVYIPAGRNIATSYSNEFRMLFFGNILKGIDSEQNLDIKILGLFLQHASRMLDKGESDFFNTHISHENREELMYISKNIEEILKGKYVKDNEREKIVLKDGTSVLLNQASSGQQESIRILQDLFMVLKNKESVSRIIEEPEVHLFPDAQKRIVELLAYFAKQGNDLIITTHSPYILTVFNNLLFANRVVEKNNSASDEVDKIVESRIRLESSTFSAYSLQRHSERKQFCENIISQTTGLIDQNYLDVISEELSRDFNSLYAIHSKSF